MSDTGYPTRCRIVDIAGQDIGGGFVAKTPEVSKPHIGQEGIAELIDGWDVRITLDNGNIIHGYECWWEPLP
jgi:hypothetical protein